MAERFLGRHVGQLEREEKIPEHDSRVLVHPDNRVVTAAEYRKPSGASAERCTADTYPCTRLS
jgi:hypothetical protein